MHICMYIRLHSSAPLAGLWLVDPDFVLVRVDGLSCCTCQTQLHHFPSSRCADCLTMEVDSDNESLHKIAAGEEIDEYVCSI